MPRWEPDPRGRLVRAAVDLFAEQGYEPTTVVQIAERAGLTKTTFFRHFPDKREVLFAGQHLLIDLARSGVAAAPPGATPVVAVGAGVEAMVGLFGEEQREYGVRLGEVIAANVELSERAAYKRTKITAAMTEALHERGIDEPAAGLAAELGIRAYYLAYQRWVTPTNTTPLTELGRQALAELHAATNALT